MDYNSFNWGVGSCFSLSLMQMFYLSEAKLLKLSDKEQEGPSVGCSPVFFYRDCLVCRWSFPVYPSVIATGSMEPMIKPGDVILVDKATSIEEIYSLREGDVIQFSRDAILISHRIIEIVEEEGVKLLY